MSGTMCYDITSDVLYCKYFLSQTHYSVRLAVINMSSILYMFDLLTTIFIIIYNLVVYQD